MTTGLEQKTTTPLFNIPACQKIEAFYFTLALHFHGTRGESLPISSAAGRVGNESSMADPPLPRCSIWHDRNTSYFAKSFFGLEKSFGQKEQEKDTCIR